VAEFRKKSGQRRPDSAKKVIGLQTAMTKKGRQFFQEKNRGDTVSCRRE